MEIVNINFKISIFIFVCKKLFVGDKYNVDGIIL